MVELTITICNQVITINNDRNIKNNNNNNNNNNIIEQKKIAHNLYLFIQLLI